jgi:RNA polymerase sigma-70 factor (ECF subfamily)
MSLLGDALAGKSEAWSRIYFLYTPLVESWCRWRGLGEIAVEDVRQIVFLTLFNNLHQFQMRPGKPSDSFRRWLKTLTNHKVTNYLREASLQYVVSCSIDKFEFIEANSDDNGDDDDHYSASRLELKQLVQRCLEIIRTEFKPNTIEACLARTVRDEPAATVALRLGMSRNAVDLANSRVKARIRDLLIELEPHLFRLNETI